MVRSQPPPARDAIMSDYVPSASPSMAPTPYDGERSASATSASSSSTTPDHSAPHSVTSSRMSSPIIASEGAASKRAAESRSSNLLFRLPKELRLRIYDFALVSPDPIRWPNPTPPKLSVQLLRTSKAICDEASMHAYTRNTFVFAHPSDVNMFRYLMSSTHAGHVQNMHLVFLDKEPQYRDTKMWVSYLGSSLEYRSLVHDFPHLKQLLITFHTSFWPLFNPETGEEQFLRWSTDCRLREVCMNLKEKSPSPDSGVRIVMGLRVRRHDFVHLVRRYERELAWVGDEMLEDSPTKWGHVLAATPAVGEGMKRIYARTRPAKVHNFECSLEMESVEGVMG